MNSPVGFFVDWNGNTRRTEAPGDAYRCTVSGGAVEVLEPDGAVCYEADFHLTLEAVEAAGVIVKLI